MSESIPPPQDHPIESASNATPTLAPTAVPLVGTADHSSASAPVLALPPALPPEPQALLELIGRGLAADADDTARAAARELWARFAQVITAAMPTAPAAPVMPAAQVMPAAPAMPPVPIIPAIPQPSSPIATAAHALRQMSPDQLLDLALQRLRAALPAGATVPVPRGIQFQLVPVMAPGSR